MGRHQQSFTLLNETNKNYAGADPGFFQRGGCEYESSRQTSQGQRNVVGGSWRVMFEYVDFRHFDFRGINLSNLRHYY